MANEKIGIWFIGAWGGVSTTVAVGLAALQQGLTNETALLTSLSPFSELNLLPWNAFTVGGHEIRQTNYLAEAEQLLKQSRVFTPELLREVAPKLAEFDQNIRPGTLINVGQTIESLASPNTLATRGERPAVALQRIQADLKEFQQRNKLDRVIVVNLASTEPPLQSELEDLSWKELEQKLQQDSESPVPASTVYAIAAMQAGASYINFTPSLGSDLEALEELSHKMGVLHCGRDGKTGETLLKSVLAPMFAARNLKVMSWVGHNIFGNMDGKVLDDPVNKATKVRSKDHLLTEILGYKPQTLVSIEYIESLGDWKTAWDHIHFMGFLNTPMIMQFTWQGCDSLLAAPLVLDLVRLTEREWRRGGSGTFASLCCFFKSPMGVDIPDFARQFMMIQLWAEQVASEMAAD